MALATEHNSLALSTTVFPFNATPYTWSSSNADLDIKLMNEITSVTLRNRESANNFTTGLQNLNATGYVALDDDVSDAGWLNCLRKFMRPFCFSE